MSAGSGISAARGRTTGPGDCHGGRGYEIFHDVERYGHLVLSGTPQQIGQLSAELRKGRPAGPVIVVADAEVTPTIYAGPDSTVIRYAGGVFWQSLKRQMPKK